jgi:hypothetical protein
VTTTAALAASASSSPLPRARCGLDVRQVRDAPCARAARLLEHAVDHERVQAVARPGVAGPERLEHHEGLAEVARVLDRAIEAKFQRVRRNAIIQ